MCFIFTPLHLSVFMKLNSMLTLKASHLHWSGGSDRLTVEQARGQSSSVPTRNPNSIITPTKSGFHYKQESTGHFVNLNTRILSDPRESVSVMTFNGERHQGMSISSVPCAICIKALSSAFFLPWSLHNTNIVQTGLGNQRKNTERRYFWQRDACKSYVFC